LEIGRGGRLGLFFLTGIAFTPKANCPITPRRYGTPDSALRADSILLGDISAMQFSYGDGSRQACRVTDIRGPQ
jgi:hypothetical protein